ncbi:MAG TPA: urease accessory protein UreF [Woeseiaceae bacterium]|nr:urease accessory protein UreF [Woeseiaceae bacterium]
MSDALFRLMSWLSPAYPVGAYAFSHGLEQAVEADQVTDRDGARKWIAAVMAMGGGYADLVFAGAAWDIDAGRQTALDALRELNQLALAFQGTAELRLESTAQGRAFASVTADAWPCAATEALTQLSRDEIVHAVAVGAVARSHGIGRTDTLTAYAHAYAANLVSAAVRLIPLGQTDAQRITAELMPVCLAAVERAAATPVDDVSSSTPMVDVASMKHEVQYTRLFRS